MKYNVRSRLENRLGLPTRHTKKLLAWHIQPGFSVALQLDQPTDEMQSGRDSYALLWLPAECAHRLTCNLEQRLYAAGEGRHSNTYASPGLEKGQSVIRLHIENSLQLELLDKALFEGNKSGM